MITSKAVEENNGKKTNEQIFEKILFPLIGYSREEINPYFDKSYEEDFPKLRKLTSRKPNA